MLKDKKEEGKVTGVCRALSRLFLVYFRILGFYRPQKILYPHLSTRTEVGIHKRMISRKLESKHDQENWYLSTEATIA